MNLEYPWDVQKIKFKNIQVFRSHQKEKYILIGNHTLTQQFCILYLNILKGQDLYQKELKHYIYEEERQFESLEDAKEFLNKYNMTYLYTVSGIIGFIKFVQGYYVMFIKRRKSIAKLGKHKIFTIEERSIVELFDGQHPQQESKYKKLFQDYDLEIGFYSSYTYDVTSTLSKNIIPSEDIQNKNQKYHQIGQYRNLFMWNHYLLTEFDKIIKDKRWVIPIIHGYCEQSTIKTVANYFSITLLARRSIKHAGARYLTRGINEQGYVANFVETEQIVIELDKSTCQRPACSSFIQIRGSAPVYWYQEPKMYLFKLPIKIHQSDPYLFATKKHICDLISSYGRQIYMVNLVKQNEHNKREQVLAEEYFASLNTVKEEMQNQTEIEIGYLGFDMKAQLKQDKEEFVNKCYSLAYYCIMKTGVFLFVKEPKCNENVIIEIQNGVVRSNCVDCLDRTNAFQQLIGEMALGIQLAKINQSSLKFNLLLLNESILQEFREMYEQLGDFISQQYGSSLAHKQNIGQKSKRIELFTSLKRHYNNNIEDPQKQNQIDLFLGIHRPIPDGPFIGEYMNIWLFPDTKYLQQYTQHKQWWVNPYLEFQQKSLIDEISRRCKEASQQAKKDFKTKIERKQTIFNFDIIEKMKHKANQKLKGKNVFILSSPYTKVREKPPNYVSKPFNLEEKLKKPYYDVIQIYETEQVNDSPCESHQCSPKLNSQNQKTRFSLLKGEEILEIQKYTRIKSFEELTEEANNIKKYLKYNLSSDDEEKMRSNLKKYLNGEQPKEAVVLIDKNLDVQKQYSEVKQSIAHSENAQGLQIQQAKKIPVEIFVKKEFCLIAEAKNQQNMNNMIIKYNELRVSITPKTQTSLNSPVRNNTQPIFITSPKQQLSSIKEITNKQKELNKLLNQHVDIQTQSANTSMQSFDCVTAQSKFRKKQIQADISSKLMYLDDEIVEVYNEFEKNYKQINDLDKIQQIRQNSYRCIEVSRKSLSNLIQTHDGLKQSDLKLGNMNRIRIDRFKFYYFRIRLRGKISPIQVFFNIPERVQSSALKMFLSTKAEFPTKFNAEYILDSRFAKIFSERNQHYFTEEYLFITIYSDVDFEFSITFNFGNSQITKSPPKQIIETLDLIQANSSSTQKHLPNDKILQNLSLTQYHGSQKLHKILSVQSERTHKQKMARSLRQSILEDKQLEKKSKLLVKDQILHFREVERQIKQKKLQTQYAQQNWFQIFSLLLITEYVSNSLQEQKRKQKVAAKGKLLVWAMKTKALLDVKEYGDSAKERTIFKTRCVIQSFASMIREKSKIKAEFVITKFMDRILLFLTILNKHQSTLNKVIFIQRKFRLLKAKKRQFRDKFWKLIKENVADIIYDLRRQKETQFFFDKQQINIDIPIMNTVIDEYCRNQRILWMAYVQHTFLEKDQKRKIHEYAKNLKEPKIYDLPNKNELIPLIEQYAKMKKIL